MQRRDRSRSRINSKGIRRDGVRWPDRVRMAVATRTNHSFEIPRRVCVRTGRRISPWVRRVEFRIRVVPMRHFIVRTQKPSTSGASTTSASLNPVELFEYPFLRLLGMTGDAPDVPSDSCVRTWMVAGAASKGVLRRWQTQHSKANPEDLATYHSLATEQFDLGPICNWIYGLL